MGFLHSSTVALFFTAGVVCGLLFGFLTLVMYNPSSTAFLRTTDCNCENTLKVDYNSLPQECKEQDHNEQENMSKCECLDKNKHGYRDLVAQSHDELELIPTKTNIEKNEDELFHKDDTTIADDLHNKVRVLCWVMTSPSNLYTKAVHVNATWGHRCNKILYVSDYKDETFPTIDINVQQGRDHLTAKTMKAFDYIYKTHLDDADWFLKVDDDTYIIMENLRYFLSAHSPHEPVFFGQHFKPLVPQGYNSGGAGYVLSREALKRFGRRETNLCAKDQGPEDVQFGRCMLALGVLVGDSRDALDRSRFHCFTPVHHLHKNYRDWYHVYDKYGGKGGMESMSDLAISFHYMSADQMYDMEYYVYHLRPYGITFNSGDLNAKQIDYAKEPSFNEKLAASRPSGKGETEQVFNAESSSNEEHKKPTIIFKQHIKDKTNTKNGTNEPH